MVLLAPTPPVHNMGLILQAETPQSPVPEYKARSQLQDHQELLLLQSQSHGHDLTNAHNDALQGAVSLNSMSGAVWWHGKCCALCRMKEQIYR